MKSKYLRQKGQSMVEFTVVLSFGIMVLTTSGGGDAMMDLLGVMHDKYRGHSYAMSLSDLPSHDTYQQYANFVGQTTTDLNDAVSTLQNFTTAPSFDDVISNVNAAGMPSGNLTSIKRTLLDGVTLPGL